MITKRLVLTLALMAAVSLAAAAQSLQLPATVVAGNGLSIPTSGSGDATLYVFGPGTAMKKKVKLGEPVQLEAEQVKLAGRYVVVLNQASGTFFVVPSKLDHLAFLARPSRVAASRTGAITGSAYLFDQYDNMVLEPEPVKFELTVEGAAPVVRTETSRNGVAWTRMNSGRKAGAAQFVASAGSADVRRVVQQTASDPCNIRMKAESAKDGSILVSTDPIRDCSGNPVPDGTIVTFTSLDQNGRSTVDARIKKGVAQATLPASQNALLSVAAGVVMGNEIRWGGGR